MSHPEPEGAVWIDGILAEAAAAVVPLRDLGVQSGMGVFETLAVRRGLPVDLEEHLRRLERSGAFLSVPLADRDTIEGAVRAVALRVPDGHGWLKIVALRGGHAAVWGGSSPRAEEGASARAILLPWRRSRRDPLAGVKSTSYATFVVGLEYARSRGADEGLWRNDRGRVTEGCASNLFAIRGRSLLTPALREGILDGVTRGKAIAAAREIGMAVHEVSLRVPRLVNAEEAFLSSSTRGIRPLLAVDGKTIGSGEPGGFTMAIARATARLRGIEEEESQSARTTAGGTR